MKEIFSDDESHLMSSIHFIDSVLTFTLFYVFIISELFLSSHLCYIPRILGGKGKLIILSIAWVLASLTNGQEPWYYFG